MKNYMMFLVFSMLLFFGNSQAQNYLLQNVPAENIDLQLRFMHPATDTYSETTSLSGVYELILSIPVSDKVNLIASLPYLHMEYEINVLPYYNYSSPAPEVRKGTGNLFFGARMRSEMIEGRQTIGTIGVYLPTCSRDEYSAASIGIRADYHNFHKYLRETTTIFANIMSYWLNDNGAHYELEIGPRILFMNSGDNSETEFLIHYCLGGSVPISVLELRLELAGVFFLSSEAETFSDKFNHTLAFGARYARGPFTPGFFYQVYLSEPISNSVSGVLGIDFVYQFGGD